MLKVPMATTYVPLGRWVRWQIVVSGGVAWDLTFRIWIAANRIGQRVPIAEATALGDLEKEASWFAAGQGPTTSIAPGGGGAAAGGGQDGSNTGNQGPGKGGTVSPKSGLSSWTGQPPGYVPPNLGPKTGGH
jgi:hypothetical protein